MNIYKVGWIIPNWETGEVVENYVLASDFVSAVNRVYTEFENECEVVKIKLIEEDVLMEKI